MVCRFAVWPLSPPLPPPLPRRCRRCRCCCRLSSSPPTRRLERVVAAHVRAVADVPLASRPEGRDQQGLPPHRFGGAHDHNQAGMREHNNNKKQATMATSDCNHRWVHVNATRWVVAVHHRRHAAVCATQAHTLARTHVCTHARKHARMHARKHARMHARRQARMHALRTGPSPTW